MVHAEKVAGLSVKILRSPLPAQLSIDETLRVECKTKQSPNRDRTH